MSVEHETVVKQILMEGREIKNVFTIGDEEEDCILLHEIYVSSMLV